MTTPKTSRKGPARPAPARDAIEAALAGGAYFGRGELAKIVGITPESTSVILRRLITLGRAHIKPGSYPAQYGKGAPPPDLMDETRPVQVIKPVGTWERKHAGLMARATWFEGVVS